MSILKAIPSCILLTLISSSFLSGANATFGFPASYSNIVAEEGRYDAASGDVIFATADHKSGAKVQISYNSRVPVTNEEMPRFLEFMSSQTFGDSKFINGRIKKKEGINWCITDLVNPKQDPKQKILLVFVSFDGSPMKFTFTSSQEVNLETIALEMIDHNNQVLVEQAGLLNSVKAAPPLH